MLTKRVIPCLDVKDGRVVKGVGFADLMDAGDPIEVARSYAEALADELLFLDITATVEKRRTLFDALAEVAGAVAVPVTVGGGIKTLADIDEALSAGAAGVSISSAAFRDPGTIKEAVERFGSERITVAIDVDENHDLPSGREVLLDGGRTPTGADALEFALEMARLGVGRILATSKRADGTRNGYDLAFTRAVADSTGLPVVASGGAGRLEHFYEAVVEGHALGLLAASVFHFGIFTVAQVKQYLRERMVPVIF